MTKSNDMFNELLAGLKADLAKPKREPKPKSEFDQNLGALKNSLRKRTPKKKQNGAGYEYVTDPESGKMVTKARVVWEEHNGRKLQDHEKVVFMDGNRRNFDPANLMAVHKRGVNYSLLVCENCGCRGKFRIETTSASNED